MGTDLITSGSGIGLLIGTDFITSGDGGDFGLEIIVSGSSC